MLQKQLLRIFVISIVLFVPLFLFQNCQVSEKQNQKETNKISQLSAQIQISEGVYFEGDSVLVTLQNIPEDRQVDCRITSSSDVFEHDLVRDITTQSSSFEFYYQIPEDSIYSLDFDIHISVACDGLKIENPNFSMTVKNNDPKPSLIVEDLQSTEGVAGQLQFVLSHLSMVPIQFTFETENITGIWGQDFSISLTDYIFAPKTKRVSVPVNFPNDEEREDDSKYGLVRITSSTNSLISDNQAHVTVGPSDGNMPYISVSNKTVIETSNYVSLKILLDKPSVHNIIFRLRPTMDSTLSELEFSRYLRDGSLMEHNHIIPAGSTHYNAEIKLEDDTIFEGAEFLVLELYDVQNALATNPLGVLTVEDPSYEEPEVSLVMRDDPLSVNNNVVVEGESAFEKFKLRYPSAFDTEVHYQLVKTCQAPSVCTDDQRVYEASDTDIVFSSGVVTVLAGQLESNEFAIQTLGDNKVEAWESFKVQITKVESGPYINATSRVAGSGWIYNDDLLKIFANTVVQVQGGETATLRLHFSTEAPENSYFIKCRVGSSSTATPSHRQNPNDAADFLTNPPEESSSFCTGNSPIPLIRGQAWVDLTFPTYDHNLGESVEIGYIEIFDDKFEAGLGRQRVNIQDNTSRIVISD